MQSEKSNATGEMPSRSHLYNDLTPIGIGTPLVESLSSYVVRLAWTYHIMPHVLLESAIIPNLEEVGPVRLSPEKLRTFCYRQALAINGVDEVAQKWLETLARLTMRNDLDHLTLSPWTKAFRTSSLLRSTPCWCPECYFAWRRDEQPIYQPQLWLFKPVIICSQHRRRLEERCCHCRQRQSVIAYQTRPGYCTQCKAWLGRGLASVQERDLDDKVIVQQEWVMAAIKELQQAGTAIEPFPREKLLFNLASFIKFLGTGRRTKPLAHLLNSFYDWLALWITSNNPSLPFHILLKLCYALNVLPVRLIEARPVDLRGPIWLDDLRHLYKPVLVLDSELAHKLVHAFLEGCELPQLRELRDNWVPRQ